MKKLNLRMFINNAKILGLALATAFTMGACKTYMTTVVAVYDNNKILVKDGNNNELLIDCSKKGSNNQQLIQDIPYFAPKDEVGLTQKNPLKNYNYDGRRVFGDDSNVKYNKDSIQIRKDREIIQKVKTNSTQTR
ncbi:MAG: hypothetical protein IJQ55_02870 [Alphaproteobacteria bacterium]|nr:hypothetical protein [Alphaproteobacteria bacterium]